MKTKKQIQKMSMKRAIGSYFGMTPAEIAETPADVVTELGALAKAAMTELAPEEPAESPPAFQDAAE